MTPTVLPREAQVDEIKDLITKGKEAGLVTSEDVSAAMQAAELPPEQMDSILQVLTEEGVEILDTTSRWMTTRRRTTPAASRRKSSPSRPRPPTRYACT